MKMDPRTKNNLTSAENKIELLRSVIMNPAKFIDDEYLFQSLHSQGSFAKYKNETLHISSCFLNTLKRVSTEHIPGGWAEINKLRIEALERLNIVRAQPSVNLTDLKELDALFQAQLEKVVTELRKANLVLLRTIGQLLLDIQQTAETPMLGARQKLAAESDARARANLRSNLPPFDRPELPKVVPITGR